MEAEFVVVGSGSAGAALAGRLVEAGRDVILIEAGPDYGSFDSGRWPPELLDARMLATSHDWGYTQDRWVFERARVMGGCSSHNGAIAALGHRRDYDGWQLPGWSTDDVSPLFDEVVRRMRVRAYERSEAVPFHAQCVDAAEAMGWHIASDLCDLDANESFGMETVNVDGTTRWNAAFAYLDPVRGAGEPTHRRQRACRPGCRSSRRGDVVRRAQRRASRDSRRHCCAQRRGVRHTGDLATLRCGDQRLLSSLGIATVVDRASVGANLHDHPMFHADRTVRGTLQTQLDEAAASGFLPEEQTLGKFVSVQATDGIFDLHLFPVVWSNQTSLIYGRATIEVAVMTPRSRGSVQITSADPAAAPLIDHAYLTDPDGHDLAVMRDGLRIANEMLDHPILASLLGEPVTDGSTDQAIRDQVTHYYHPVGTCRMGTEADLQAVCDVAGRVFGLDHVVVADASLMPQIPRANTNLPTVMIGERIAQLLLAD